MNHYFLSTTILALIISCVEKKPRKPIAQVKIENECQTNLSSIYLTDQHIIQEEQVIAASTTNFEDYHSILVMPVKNDTIPSQFKNFVFSNTISFYVSKKNIDFQLAKNKNTPSKPTTVKKQNTFQDSSYTFENFIKSSSSYKIHKKIQESEERITNTEKYFQSITDGETAKRLNDEESYYKFIGDTEVKIQDSLENNLQKAVAIKHLNHEQSSEYKKAIEQGEKDISSWISQMKADYKEWKFLKQQVHIAQHEKGRESILSLIIHIENRYRQTKPEDFEHRSLRSKADDLADETTRVLSLQWFQAKKIHFLKSEELAAFQKEFNKRKIGPWQEIAFRAQDRWEKYRLPVMFVLTAVAVIQLKQVLDSSSEDNQEDIGATPAPSSETPLETTQPEKTVKKTETLILTPFRPEEPENTPIQIELKKENLIPWTPLQSVKKDLCLTT